MELQSSISNHLLKAYKIKLSNEQIQLLTEKVNDLYDRSFIDYYGYNKVFYIAKVRNSQSIGEIKSRSVDKLYTFFDTQMLNDVDSIKIYPVCRARHSMSKVLLYILSEGFEDGLNRISKTACRPTRVPHIHNNSPDFGEGLDIMGHVTKRKHSIYFICLLILLLDGVFTIELPDNTKDELKKLKEINIKFVDQIFENLRG